MSAQQAFLTIEKFVNNVANLCDQLELDIKNNDLTISNKTIKLLSETKKTFNEMALLLIEVEKTAPTKLTKLQ